MAIRPVQSRRTEAATHLIFDNLFSAATIGARQLTSVLTDVGVQWKAFQTSGTGALEASLSKQLDTDVAALTNLGSALGTGADMTAVFGAYMSDASTEAKNWALSNDLGSDSIQKFTVQQTQANAAQVASGEAAKTAALGQQAFSAALNFGVMLAVSLAIQGIQRLIQVQEENRRQAQADAQAYQSAAEEMDNYAAKVETLRLSLDAGTLSEEKAAQAREDLMEIQKKLISMFGSEAYGLDLVNGSLEEQLDLIDRLSRADASNYLTADRSEIDTATDKMTKNKLYFVATNMQTPSVSKSVEEIIDSMEHEGFKVTKLGASMSVRFTGNAEDAQAAFNELSSEIRALERNEWNADAIDDWLNNIAKSYNKATTIVDEYGETYHQAIEAQIRDNAEWFAVYNDYANAIDNFNQAIATGDVEDIKAAREEYENTKNKVDELTESHRELLPAFEELTAQVSSMDFLDTAYPQLQDQLNKVGLSASDAARLVNQMSEVDPGSGSLAVIPVLCENFNNEIAAMTEQLNLLEQAQEEYNSTGTITAETMQKLSENDLLNYLRQTTEGLEIDTSAIRSHYEALTDGNQSALEDAAAIAIYHLAVNGAGGCG
ncbi:MAG: hypothetical protein LIO46_04180, partial [Clostridiales bacterium]|nr:hypothetical protein [Clostridiales bacterium]